MNLEDATPADPGLRKAAVLVAGLDRKTAERVLERLGPEQAQRLRQFVVDLGEIDPKEQRRVIDEFFRIGPMVPGKHPPGIELDGRLALEVAVPQTGEPAGLPPADTPPFQFLQETEGEKLARVLASERPQTIALVLSHLLPEQAGKVLARLQPALQAEVIHRLVGLEETDPEILCEVERALESRLSQQVRVGRRRVAGLEAVSAILQACNGGLAVEILDNLAAHDQPLAERLGGETIQFDDLAWLDDAALDTVFQAAERELAMTALVGAPPELIDRVLRRSSPAEAKTIRHKLNHPGPIRLNDVEDARGQIAELVRRLALQGLVQLPHQEPITAG